MGTVSYMSPEQARGLEVDARSDIFSLGVMLYEMLAGSRPFAGETANDVMAAILTTEPPPLARFAPGAPRPLQQIIGRAMAKDRERRYQAIRDLLLDLKNLKRELEIEPRLRRLSLAQTGEIQPPLDTQYPADATTLLSLKPATQPGGQRANLSAPPTPLIGRESELAAVKQLLLEDGVRLLTLTGPGGAGKTRLAQQAALELVGEFADGVWFVSLASISDPGLVASVIAQTLELKEVSDLPLVATLKDRLRDQQILLLLDNFEQIIPAGSLVAELLSACSRLKALVTSRAALKLRWEREFPVPLATNTARLTRSTCWESCGMRKAMMSGQRPCSRRA